MVVKIREYGVFAVDQTLLVCKHLQRNHFEHERYQGKDDILALVEKGSFFVNDGTGEQLISELEAVCFKAGQFYERHVVEPVVLYLFRYQGGNNALPSGRLTFRDQERVRSTIHLLQAAEEHPNELSCKQILFRDLVNQYLLENPTGARALADRDPVISGAVQELQANLYKKQDLRALAEKNYLSYVQFSRRFKAAMGVTVQEYMAQLRLKKAKTLLADSDLPVKEIARSCGFANEYYFSNFFRKHTGTTPTAFRSLEKSMEGL